jgi:hypothetical protein
MTEPDNLNNKYVIKYVINNTIISDTNTVTISACQFFVTMWPRVVREIKNSGFDF